jgi:RNA polymerase sigma-70 factor (ECF subfamily)
MVRSRVQAMPSDDVGIETLLADDRFVRGLARRLVRDSSTAEDVVQETYLEALERRPSAAVSLRGWLGKVVRHVASNFLRADGRRARRERRAARPEAQPPEALLLEREETRRRLVDAVLSLRAPRSTVLILRYFENLPPRAIARRLGMPVETVRTHLKRGLAQLRARLGAEHREDGSSFLAALPLLLPRPRLATAALGVAAMTTTTKIALSGLVALAAVTAWLVVRPPVDRTMPAEPSPSIAAPAIAGLGPESPAAPAEAVARTPLVATGEKDGTADTASARPAGTLRGIVLGPNGAPVEGAAIRGGPRELRSLGIEEKWLLQRLARGEDLTARPEVRPDGGFEALSGSDGTFELEGLPPDDSYVLAAWVEELGVAVVEGVPVRDGPTDPVILRFAPAVVLHGTVTDRKGAPVPEASMMVLGSLDGTSYTSWPFNFPVREDGTWRTPPLARVTFSVTATARGYRREHRFVSWDPRIDRTVRVHFRLEPAPPLRGTLVRADGSAARLGESLRTLGLSASDLVLLASELDPAREANFRDLHHREGVLDLEADRWEMETENGVPFYVSLWRARTLLGFACPEPGEEAEIAVDLDRLTSGAVRRSILVSVRDPAGRPVMGARGRRFVSFERPVGAANSFGGLQFLVPVEGKEGVLKGEDVEVGHHEIRIWADGFVPRRVPFVLVEGGGPAPIAVTLVPANHRVAAVVRTAGGEPVAGARVHVLDAEGLPVDLALEPKTNLEGRAEIAGLGEGRYDFFVTHEEWASAGKRVWVPAGPQALDFVLVEGEEVCIEPVAPTSPFEFRIEDAAGVPVRDDACEGRRHHGSFTARLAPGSYTVTVRGPGFAPGRTTFEVEPGLRIAVPMKPADG